MRTDALKLLAMMRRPTPRGDATIGAWLNIFQVVIVKPLLLQAQAFKRGII